jgi:shikimate dehydrogenase
MQEAGFRALGIDASYTLIPVEPENLLDRIRQMRQDGFSGWNVTIPHKAGVIAALDTVDPVAAQVQSVNTVVNRDGHLSGYSTDGYGLAESMRESFGNTVSGGRFVFWGVGGAARATAAYFAEQGAADITLVNRTEARAVELADVLRSIAPDCQIQARSMAGEETLGGVFDEADVIFQCTSVGLHEGDTSAIPDALLARSRAVLDMIYRQTPTLTAAAACGAAIANGRGMLLHQGVKSLSIWTGCDEPPVAAMREALDRALA